MDMQMVLPMVLVQLLHVSKVIEILFEYKIQFAIRQYFLIKIFSRLPRIIAS